MPEGDTIHKLAAYLQLHLTGCRIVDARLQQRATSLAGRVVTAATAQGKHLYLDLDDGHSIRSHLGMFGSWHRYPDGARWQKPARRASLVLAVTGESFVCFDALEVEILRPGGPRARQLHSRVGPDLITEALDGIDIAARARSLHDGDALICDVLLDQRVAAGIGNVYKSEILFIECRLPASTLSAVDDASLAGLYERARVLLSMNTGGGPRVTRSDLDGTGRLWVYNRGGLPCHGCHGTISTARLGRRPRATYWCPRCQR